MIRIILKDNQHPKRLVSRRPIEVINERKYLEKLKTHLNKSDGFKTF